MQPAARWTRFLLVASFAIGLALMFATVVGGPAAWSLLAFLAVMLAWLALGFARVRRAAAADPSVLHDSGRVAALLFGSPAAIAGIVLSLAAVLVAAVYLTVGGR